MGECQKRGGFKVLPQTQFCANLGKLCGDMCPRVPSLKKLCVIISHHSLGHIGASMRNDEIDTWGKIGDFGDCFYPVSHLCDCFYPGSRTRSVVSVRLLLTEAGGYWY